MTLASGIVPTSDGEDRWPSSTAPNAIRKSPSERQSAPSALARSTLNALSAEAETSPIAWQLPNGPTSMRGWGLGLAPSSLAAGTHAKRADVPSLDTKYVFTSNVGTRFAITSGVLGG